MKRSDPGTPIETIQKDAVSSSESRLQAMGINNPTEISRYILREEGNEDVLRIYYKRTKGSLLPESKTFRLGRVHKAVVADSGVPKYAEGDEMSPHSPLGN